LHQTPGVPSTEVLSVKALFVIALVLAASTVDTVFGQFPQARRARERMDQSIKASEDREYDARLARESALPVPKPAVMNVDVQMVLSKAEHKTFLQAKAAEAKKVVDGEPLWMYMKFAKGKLGDYVLTSRDPDDPQKLRYTLYAELAPHGDVTALNQYTIQFAKEDLGATEVKIGLAPAMFGRNKSIPVFLMTSGAAKTGVWNNELRVTNNVTIPRDLNANLATAAVTLDFTGGLAKYRKMDSEYDSIVLRGSTDPSKMPVAGTFFSAPLAEKVAARVAAEGILADKVYFSGDGWQEYAAFGLEVKKLRKIFATFTYRAADKCMYGVAEIVQNYDFAQAKYGDSEIKVQKDLPAQCVGSN
jgi:hypothetical protein